MNINSSDWFRHVTGFPESQWNYKMSSIPDADKYAGSFKTYQLSKLREIAQPATVVTRRPLTIRLRGPTSCEDDFDTSSLQYNGPDGAMYQVASNFNCLAVPHERTNPFSGLFLTRLMSDSTQEPSAAAGAAHGAILRLAIHRKKPINLLEDTALADQVDNGKLYARGLHTTDIDISKVKVGLHRGVCANFNRPLGSCSYNPEGPTIDQVYTSTCILSSRGSHPLAAKLLAAAYEGTYLCAIKRGSTRLVLTLIGGGCFMNSYVQILTALLDAHVRYADLLPKDCEVILPIYDRHLNTYFSSAERYRPYIRVS